MKSLILLSLLLASTSAFSFEDKCYDVAKEVAFHAVKDDQEITDIEDFSNYYGDESVEVFKQKNGWQKEFWIFSNISSMIHVEIHAVTTNCHVKKVEFSQNDQDWE